MYRHHFSVLLRVDQRRRPTYLADRLAEAVRERRSRLELSQEQLAATCELHRTYVSAIERGERNVSLVILEAFAVGLGCDPAELVAPRGKQDL